MEALVNDLSLHGQFADMASFRAAIERIMRMRATARTFGRSLLCHRNLAHAQITPNLTMPQAIQSFDTNARRVIMQWLTCQGPFWEDARDHGPDEYLECSGQVVTDTAVGEAAFRTCHGVDHQLVSLSPSSWSSSPLDVIWTCHDGEPRHIQVQNHSTEQSFEAALQAAPTPIESWDTLAEVVMARCPGLTFSADCFHPLQGHPFVHAAAYRILALFNVLNQFKGCFGVMGERTEEGHRLYRDFFVDKGGDGGNKAWFSDSSDGEKSEFKHELTFRHPVKEGDYLFCPWHGKVKSPQMRIHSSWPVRADEDLFVVYAGPKITKR